MKKHLLLIAAISLLGSAATFAEATHDHGTADGSKPKQTANQSSYSLTTCPISGQTLGSMGEAHKTEIDGREVQFCCPGCLPKVEGAKKKLYAKMDEMIITQQKQDYPRYCVVSGETFEEADAVDYVYNNQLVRFSGKTCKADFDKDPDGYMEKVRNLKENGIPKDASPKRPGSEG